MRQREHIGSELARQTLPDLLERACRGQIFIVTRHGKPCAALVPLSCLSLRGSGSANRFLHLRNSGKRMWGADSQVFLKNLRDEWE